MNDLYEYNVGDGFCHAYWRRAGGVGPLSPHTPLERGPRLGEVRFNLLYLDILWGNMSHSCYPLSGSEGTLLKSNSRYEGMLDRLSGILEVV